MITKTDILILLTLVLVQTSLFAGGLYYINSQYQHKYDSFVMEEGIPESHRNGINGLYFSSEGYYCVWTEGRTMDEVMSTDYHETCHDLVHNDYEHFCKCGES